jgi:hypothetical protein
MSDNQFLVWERGSVDCPKHGRIHTDVSRGLWQGGVFGDLCPACIRERLVEIGVETFVFTPDDGERHDTGIVIPEKNDAQT